jgi:hypothetical protein
MAIALGTMARVQAEEKNSHTGERIALFEFVVRGQVVRAATKNALKFPPLQRNARCSRNLDSQIVVGCDMDKEHGQNQESERRAVTAIGVSH